MLTRAQFQARLAQGPLILDGATGSNLQAMGMPRGGCTEKWVLDNPQALLQLQEQYVRAGSDVIYAPTFQAQPIALERVGLAEQTERINCRLAQLSRSVSSQVLVAGDLTTLATFTDSFDENNFDLLVDNYSRQIRGLLDGGVDLLVAETLMYSLEAEAILTAAELEGAEVVMYSFTMQSDGSLFSGADAGSVLQELEMAGAAAVGFNCVAADSFTCGLVSKLRRSVSGPLLCKPNAGIPVLDSQGNALYPMSPEEFARIGAQCHASGAAILGGCCGTSPEHIRALKAIL